MQIINDIPDNSKIEPGDIHLEEIDIDLRALLQRVVQMNLFRANLKGVELKLDYDIRLPNVFKGDPIRICQIINNLLSNVIKFTEAGNVIVTVSFVKMIREYIEIKFIISNAGVGMKPENQRKGSEMMDQDKVISAMNLSGNELISTTNILRVMNSQLSIEREIGRGYQCDFILKVLIGDQDHGTQINKLPLSLYNLSEYKLRILIVDDSEMDRLMAQQLFKKCGVNTDCAADGSEAIEKIKSIFYNMVLMDLKMLSMNGFEAIRQIRQLDHGRIVPILSLSNSSPEHLQLQGMENGITDFVTKPYTITELYQKVTDNLFRATQKLEDANDLNESLVINHAQTSVDLDEILEKITSGDSEFKKTLILLYIDNFNELKSEFIFAFEMKDAVRAGRIEHKMKVTLNSLKQTKIMELLTLGRKMIDGIEAGSDSFKFAFKESCTIIIDKLNFLRNG